MSGKLFLQQEKCGEHFERKQPNVVMPIWATKFDQRFLVGYYWPKGIIAERYPSITWPLPYMF